MWKWILALLVIFLLTWIFAKQYVPQQIRYSGFGEMADVVLFPLEYKIEQGSFKGGKFGRSVVNLTEQKFRQIMEGADKKNVPLVVYFYDSEAVFNRIVLHQINELAKVSVSKGVLFLVVSFDVDKNRNNFLLNVEESLYFRPLATEPNFIKDAKYYYAKKEIALNETPVVLYKDKMGIYQNVGADYGTKGRLEGLIGR